jgi:hypothetical protein
MTEPGFIKALGRWDTLAVGFGAMIGFGWVVLVGGWLEDAGTLGAALAFVAGGVVMTLVGLTTPNSSPRCRGRGASTTTRCGRWARGRRS